MTDSQIAKADTYLIGINGGGTHTTFALVDSALSVIATAETGATNYHYVGEEQARQNLSDGIAALTTHVPLAQISAVGAGIAGVDRPDDHALMLNMISVLCPGIPVVLENDALSALAAGVGSPFGIVTICGTGMIAYGVNRQRQRERAGGWGYGIDLGSGYAMAREALYTASRAHDEKRACPLSDRLTQRLELADPTGLITWLYAPDRRIDEVAALASEVVKLADAGDPDSCRIITHAARELAECTIITARKLGYKRPISTIPGYIESEDGEPTDVLPILMSGSLFTYSALLKAMFIEAVQVEYPNAVPFETDRPAAVGAAALALPALNIVPPRFEIDRSNAVHRLHRATERRNPLTMNIPRNSVALLHMMNLEDERVPRLMRSQLPKLAELARLIARKIVGGGRLFLVGAGTSGRLAVLDAAECRPTFSTTPEQVIGIIAGGDQAFLQAIEGAEDDMELGATQLSAFNLTANDVVVGISASGSTPWVLGALTAARLHRAVRACIVNAAHSAIGSEADYAIVIPTGAEALTGSTRLKAGSAQKMALNMLTTAALTWAGRAYSNLMTDVQRSNVKLDRRAVRIVMDAARVSYDRAETTLTECSGVIKLAILVLVKDISRQEAEIQLAEVNGDLYRLLPPPKR